MSRLEKKCPICNEKIGEHTVQSLEYHAAVFTLSEGSLT